MPQLDNILDGRGAAREVINLPPPRWATVLPILLLSTQEAADPEMRAAAERELTRMAQIADRAAGLVAAARELDRIWSRDGRETPETMGLAYPAWQISAWRLVRELLQPAEGR